MVEPFGKFNMNCNELDRFWDIYCQNVEGKLPVIGLAERPNLYLPVLVDVDLKFDHFADYCDGDALISRHHIQSVVSVYQATLRDLVENCEDRQLYCFVLEKPSYRKTEKNGTVYIKNGFHLHFPFVFLKKDDHENYLLPKVKRAIDTLNPFRDLGAGFEVASKFIDSGYLKAPWLMYGARKSPSMQPYLLSRIINEDGEEIGIADACKDCVIYDQNEQLIDVKGREYFFLPRILSILSHCRPVSDVKTKVMNVVDMSKPLKANFQPNRDYKVHDLKGEIQRAQEVLSMISDERSDDRNDWMAIGWALYNIGDGAEEALELWKDFSSRCPEKYDETVCDYHWGKMSRKNMGIGTLKYFARIDSPLKYSKYIDEKLDRHISDSLKGCSHNDIAKALFIKYGTEFKCASITHGTWYRFSGHTWKRIDAGVDLSMKISDESPGSILHKFNQKFIELSAKIISAENEGERKMYQFNAAQIQKICSSLKCSPFKKNVMAECREVFYDDSFSSKLGKNPFLIGFKNGVYDLKLHIFRNGMPEDYISRQTAIDYVEFDEKDPGVQLARDYLMKIFPDTSIREYFMDVTSEIFLGGNIRKIILFWSGEGNNGKSITQLIFEKMLGEYAIKLPTSLIVGKRTQASVACPELARSGDGVRWAVLQEPDKKDVINIGIMKELSGNDTFFARGLYQEGSEIQPMFKLAVICNEPPMIPHSDKATWNRIRVIPFESTFSTNAPEDPAQQLYEKIFPMDMNFEEKIPSLLEPMAWILLQHFKKSKRTSAEPEKVKLATASYRKKNDVYRQFIEEIIIGDKDASISILELYPLFKNWFRESMPNQQIPTKSEVKEYFTRIWGPTEQGTIWKGYKRRPESADNFVIVDSAPPL
jgi:P4 family phage/plasmid primase-like protien